MLTTVVRKKQGLEIIDVGVVDKGVFTMAPGIRQFILVIIHIHDDRQPHLLEIADALGRQCLLLGFGKSRQEHARQDGNDGDDHQQFDEGETLPGNHPGRKNCPVDDTTSASE